MHLMSLASVKVRSYGQLPAVDLHNTSGTQYHTTTCRNTDITMINAVLVFNNSGQPRLTKFYTQLVCVKIAVC
jgi:hypothetical protein